jgi:hypothetical protein
VGSRLAKFKADTWKLRKTNKGLEERDFFCAEEKEVSSYCIKCFEMKKQRKELVNRKDLVLMKRYFRRR